jgi:pilus assembly protein CpaD
MREMPQNLFRGLCLAAVLAAGSCTVPFTKDADNFYDPAANHPLLVEPSYQSVKLSYNGGNLDPADASKLDNFISDYRQHGNGKLAISVPGGPGMAQIATSLATQINEMGVSRDRILIASRDAAGDPKVELNYISYQARTTPCGDWSEDLAFTADNRTPANFGCATQHNIAAMVSDPRDLLGPRPMDDGSAARRRTVIGNYESGKATGAEKNPDQQSTISNIGK